MAEIINDNTSIAVLDSMVTANTCTGKFEINLSPTVWVGEGNQDADGASIKILNTTRGTITKDFPEYGFDIEAPFTDTAYVNIPTVAGTYQFGDYTVIVKLSVGGSEYSVSKSLKLCAADEGNKKVGCLTAEIRANCQTKKVSVVAYEPLPYQGKQPYVVDGDFVLHYPTSSQEPPLTTPLSNFSVRLYEGVYVFSGSSCVTYSFGDNVFIKMKYVYDTEKKVICKLNYECISNGLLSLVDGLNKSCTTKEKDEIQNTVIQALVLISAAESSLQSGFDASEAIEQLQYILRCDCDCGCGGGVEGDPASDVLIEGCGITKEVTGLTTTYTINNREYVLTTDRNGGAITVLPPIVEDCTVTQKIVFDVKKVYSQIKGLIKFKSEYDYWASVINVSLNNINAICFGITDEEWAKMTLRERIASIMVGACSGGNCYAKLDSVSVHAEGSDLVVKWKGFDDNLREVSLYIDGILAASSYFDLNTMGEDGKIVVKGAADGKKHTYKLVPKCENGVFGEINEGEYSYFGCPYITPLKVTTASVIAECPYNLTTLIPAIPSGVVSEWHNQNNTQSSSLVANPKEAPEGVYYVFAKDNRGCYSDGVQVTLVCTTVSCSAPQQLMAEKLTSGVRVSFVSAKYPPSSYIVKRRLANATDIPANYTTLNGVSYNSSTNRWEVLDTTTSDNVAYVYRAISLCPDSQPYIDAKFVNITCPVTTLTVQNV